MTQASSCEFCNAELVSLKLPCPRCSLLPMAEEEEQWIRKLVTLRNATRYSIGGTVAVDLCILMFSLEDGFVLLLVAMILQLQVYDYYGRRIAGQEATLPGPASVTTDASLSSRKAWDVWAMACVVIPAVASVLMLGKHLIHSVR